MNKDIMLGILIGFILTVIFVGVGGFLVYQKLNNPTFGLSGAGRPVGGSLNGSGGNCPPATGETAFAGKVATISPPDHPDYKQYVLQSADGQTVYLITTSAQESSLQGKMGKDLQVNGTPAAPDGSWTGGVKVTTICP
ncbi:TPA: hypothetical protein DCZ81_01605 [Candidatus Collierbacteria bacterium]|nr:hypothetical protein [Candidatus Collierbacteria bacterium]